MVTAYLRKERYATAAGNNEWKNVSNNIASPEISAGQEELQVQSKSSLQPRRGPWRSRLSPCSPWAPTQGRPLHSAMEEPMLRQWVRPEWDTAHGEPSVGAVLQAGAAALESNPQRGRGARGAAAHGDSGGAVPGVWASRYGVVLDQCWESCHLRQTHLVSVWQEPFVRGVHAE